MKCFSYYLLVFFYYFDFKDRASRYEFFSFFLGNLFILFCLSLLDLGFNINFLSLSWLALILIPSLSVSVRRLHDTNHSGWFLLVPFYNIYLLLLPEQECENQYSEYVRIIEEFEVHP